MLVRQKSLEKITTECVSIMMWASLGEACVAKGGKFGETFVSIAHFYRFSSLLNMFWQRVNMGRIFRPSTRSNVGKLGKNSVSSFFNRFTQFPLVAHHAIHDLNSFTKRNTFFLQHYIKRGSMSFLTRNQTCAGPAATPD